VSSETPHFNFLATGIGSVPFTDVEGVCRDILDHFPSMPFWPQLVKRSHLEDMSIQYCEGLPLLEIRETKRSLVIMETGNREEQLVGFYDRFLSKDLEHFAISRDHAPGLYTLIEFLEQDGVEGDYIKGQTVGPITFAAGITDLNGNSVLYNPELLEAMAQGLAIKALWQVRKLAKCGRRPILFLDEPYLSGFGSAFSPIERDEVIGHLRTVINYVRKDSDALVGIHCCGNTDWSMLLEAGPDIINFDAFEYMDYFLLYPDDIVRFLKSGGTVAWGVVPTSDFAGEVSTESLFRKLQEGLERICQWDIDSRVLANASILTPACGMGTMTPEGAKKGIDLLSQLSRRLSA